MYQREHTMRRLCVCLETESWVGCVYLRRLESVLPFNVLTYRTRSKLINVPYEVEAEYKY